MYYKKKKKEVNYIPQNLLINSLCQSSISIQYLNKKKIVS